MFKFFTIDRIIDEQITETKGLRAFYLTDELGDKRIVYGTTLLDGNLNPVSIQAEKEREHPLIEYLFTSKLKDTISIEFSQYNEIFKREFGDVTEQTLEEIARDMQSKPIDLAHSSS